MRQLEPEVVLQIRQCNQLEGVSFSNNGLDKCYYSMIQGVRQLNAYFPEILSWNRYRGLIHQNMHSIKFLKTTKNLLRIWSEK